jgi:hypothetical protein
MNSFLNTHYTQTFYIYAWKEVILTVAFFLLAYFVILASAFQSNTAGNGLVCLGPAMLKGQLVTCRDSLWPGHTAVQSEHRYRRCKIQLQNILPSSYSSLNELCSVQLLVKTSACFRDHFCQSVYGKEILHTFSGEKFR